MQIGTIDANTAIGLLAVAGQFFVLWRIEALKSWVMEQLNEKMHAIEGRVTALEISLAKRGSE